VVALFLASLRDALVKNRNPGVALGKGRLALPPANFPASLRDAGATPGGKYLVAGISDAVFVAHAARASRTKAFCRRVALLGKPLPTLSGPENSSLLALGAVAEFHPQKGLTSAGILCPIGIVSIMSYSRLGG
jgi:hypothetical protein